MDFARVELGENISEIFQSQIMMLHDAEFVGALERRIKSERRNADFLINEEIEHYKSLLITTGDALFRDRIDDLDEIKHRLMRNLQRKRLHSTVEGSHIIVAGSLTPADTLLFSKNDVLGYATDTGGITSHAAILARSLKIPAVVGLHNLSSMVVTGDQLILDGQRGIIIIHPSEKHLNEYRTKIERIEELEESLAGLVDLPCETPDGRKVELSANAEFVNELEYVLTQGSRGIGLYRTEHLYIELGEFPSEQEQYIAYSEIAHIMYPQTVIIQSFDIGGDKYLESDRIEENPFLGWRGIRIMLDKPDVFRHQLRAILRASATKNIKLMFPMISGLNELREAKGHLDAVREELTEKGVKFDAGMEVGIMIEVPSAIFVADELAKEVDFFSIGTNVLVQFLLAVDRNNDLISELYQEFHPSVLRAIRHVIDVGHEHGIWVGLCGEMAGNPVATVLLLGLELDEFSLVPAVLPEIKKIIRNTTHEEAKRVAAEVLSMQTVNDVQAYLEEYTRSRYPEFFISDPDTDEA